MVTGIRWKAFQKQEEVMRKRILAWLCTILFCISTATTVFAHSGRTDRNGGHKDNKNKSGLGSYHYHCGGYSAHLHTGGYCPYTDVFPTSVSVSVDKTTLKIGEQIAISASVLPSNACNTSVSWKCSDTSVIKLSDGVITAVGYGTATITATSFNDKVGSLTITVKEIVAETVTISDEKSSDSVVYIGDELHLVANISPGNVDNPIIVWSSSNEDVAQVNDSGVVQTLSSGTATISATASNGVVGTYVIKVNEKPVESVEILENDRLFVCLGEECAVQAEVLPSDATYPGVKWTSSDSTIAEISQTGIIVGKKCGVATITATSENGLSDTIIVEINEVVAEQIEILGARKIIIGEEADLNVAFYPENTTIQTIEWTTADATIAKIDHTGKVEALQIGTTTVIAKGQDVETSIVIQIIPRAVNRIEITSSLGDIIHLGDETEFTAVVYPSNATYPNVSWTTSDSNIAVIDENGLLKAKSTGTVTISARSGDGFTETYVVEVILGMESALIGLSITAAIGIGGYVFVKKKKVKTSN